MTLVWVSVWRRRKDHSYAPLCKYYIYMEKRIDWNSRSILSGWLSRRQLLDDFPLTIPEDKYCNYRVEDSNLWTFVCLLWMRTIPQVDSDHSCIFLTWKLYISWGHLSPCSICTRAYPYLKKFKGNSVGLVNLYELKLKLQNVKCGLQSPSHKTQIIIYVRHKGNSLKTMHYPDFFKLGTSNSHE